MSEFLMAYCTSFILSWGGHGRNVREFLKYISECNTGSKAVRKGIWR